MRVHDSGIVNIRKEKMSESEYPMSYRKKKKKSPHAVKTTTTK